MLRKLKPHEERLLRKVDIYDWKREHNIREIKIIRRYHIQKREDYAKYVCYAENGQWICERQFNYFSYIKRYLRLCGDVKKLTNRLVGLPPTDPVRQELTEQLLTKLYNMGLIDSKKNLSKCDKLTASSFCRYININFLFDTPLNMASHTKHIIRRRLPVVMVRLRMAENLKQAITYIEQGRILIDIIIDFFVLFTMNYLSFTSFHRCSCWATNCNRSCVLGNKVGIVASLFLSSFLSLLYSLIL